MKRLILLALVLTGCGSQNDAAPQAMPPDLKQISDGLDKSKAKEDALRKQIASDPSPLIDFAKNKMKDAVAENYGSDVADKATIKADASGITAFGPDKWEVTGDYKGTDKHGTPVVCTWTAKIFLIDSLQCSSVKLNMEQRPVQVAPGL